MSLSRKIAAALADPSLLTPGILSADEPPHHLTLDARAASPLGVELNALDFQIDNLSFDLAALRAWGERIAQRITYLMEPLVLIEIDPLGVEAELRSQHTTRRDGLRNYYEARLNQSGHLRLTRRAFDDVTRRPHDVPFQLSREVVERLADDLVDTAR
ncbi:MAG: hypothetical protein KatS3mg108_0554 [Isosphaeraceae bacterium]|jgi:hypothetical protein|nr:MAG: hypothetical protein KatS3mg108_0554 [Isosphaeraceae bacterium]